MILTFFQFPFSNLKCGKVKKVLAMLSWRSHFWKVEISKKIDQTLTFRIMSSARSPGTYFHFLSGIEHLLEGARGGARVPLPVFSAAVSKSPGSPGISENFFSAARARACSLSCISDGRFKTCQNWTKVKGQTSQIQLFLKLFSLTNSSQFLEGMLQTF